mmetsp:Transcript_23764/g.69600  ORF Transcript_23764/g.69600 Transcript_23764/m.69600 type:complete len:207 (-) Transcript_23764:736-1356(-)
MDNLVDVLRGLSVAADLYPHWVAKHLCGKLLHLALEGRREQERLAVWPNLVHDGAHLILEPHVEHAVCFIEDNHGATAEVRGLGSNKLHQPSGGGDHDFSALLERTGHLPLALSTKDSNAVAAKGLEVPLRVAVYLLHQFPGRCQNESNGAVARRKLLLGHGMGDHGPEEGERLAGPRARDANDIPATEGGRKGCGLNRRGGLQPG